MERRGKTGDPRKKKKKKKNPADQRLPPARFPHAKIPERLRRESDLVRLGGRRIRSRIEFRTTTAQPGTSDVVFTGRNPHCFARRGDDRVNAHVSFAPSPPALLGLRRAKCLQSGGHLNCKSYVMVLSLHEYVITDSENETSVIYLGGKDAPTYCRDDLGSLPAEITPNFCAWWTWRVFSLVDGFSQVIPLFPCTKINFIHRTKDTLEQTKRLCRAKRKWSSTGNEMVGETGYPRENPPTSPIVHHNPPLMKIREWPGRGLNPIRLGGRRANRRHFQYRVKGVEEALQHDASCQHLCSVAEGGAPLASRQPALERELSGLVECVMPSDPEISRIHLKTESRAPRSGVSLEQKPMNQPRMLKCTKDCGRCPPLSREQGGFVTAAMPGASWHADIVTRVNRVACYRGDARRLVARRYSNTREQGGFVTAAMPGASWHADIVTRGGFVTAVMPGASWHADIVTRVNRVALLPRRCPAPRGTQIFGQITCLPPMRTRFDSRRGRFRTTARLNHVGRCRWPAGFLDDLPFPHALAFRRFTGDKATLIKCAIASKRKALNWRAAFFSERGHETPAFSNTQSVLETNAILKASVVSGAGLATANRVTRDDGETTTLVPSAPEVGCTNSTASPLASIPAAVRYSDFPPAWSHHVWRTPGNLISGALIRAALRGTRRLSSRAAGQSAGRVRFSAPATSLPRFCLNAGSFVTCEHMDSP
ncbi:hypothetical protein PR048_026044 [Dryococelus australis]|uniref:Uncharacterized protein n=1 Tax=Dryococelus australis TaxID=614101 RepID=A0ABQ9GK93_9NEOP|nr:hypothetical protein PR048_026044 [Dryococelus australis]